MGYSSSEGSTTSTQLHYLPGQKAYMQEFLSPLKSVYSGDFSASPMYSFAKNAADKEVSNLTSEIASQKGLTSSARSKLLQQLASKGASAATSATSSTWTSALEVLSKYALASPTVTSSTTGGGGTSVGCWIWTYFNGKFGEDTNLARKFRNERYGKGSFVDVGYKKIGEFLQPLLGKSRILRVVVKGLIYKPLTRYIKGERGAFLCLYAFIWEKIFSSIGKLSSHLMTRIAIKKEKEDA